MKPQALLVALPAAILMGCAAQPSGSQPERGPDGTVAYQVEVDSSPPGVRIEVNNEYMGRTPLTLKVYGDKDGTFHNFGSYTYTITAHPIHSGQMPQSKQFQTGGWFTPEDKIPKKVFFEFHPE